MSYTALYRKFRPTTFQEVKGQDAIVTTLKNQIQSGRIGHAYLFCGTRGTGKTSVAKIFAKAVNCEHPVEGDPCGACESCESIANGTSMNVIEIDAASNNGVDNIREIREEVAYRPTEGRYKVYIIDEVHMLSIGAFNALLKTLEEPPEYVIFILATTEAHKIPVTILSRCQRYDFHRMTMETLVTRLRELMEKETIQGEEKAVRYIARKADGSMRDALSLLDQCMAFYPGEPLSYTHVLEVLGAVDTEVFGKLVDQLVAKDTRGALQTIEELVMDGRELSQLTTDLTWYLRNLLLVKSADGMEEIVDASPEQMERLREKGNAIAVDQLMRFIRVFSELSNQLRLASQKRVLLEVTVIKLCNPAMETVDDSMLDRIRALEQRVEQSLAEKESAQKIVYVTEQESVKPATPGPQLPPAVAEEVKKVAENFPTVRAKASMILGTCLKKARLSVDEQNRLLVVMPDEMSREVMAKEEHVQELKDLIAEEIGKTVQIKVEMVQQGKQFEDTFADIEKYVKMPIEVED